MRKILMHSLFWVSFFMIWNRMMYFYISNNLNRIYFSLLDVGMIIIAFYTLSLSFMPYYFKRKQLWILITYSVGLVALLSGLSAWMMQFFLQHNLFPIHFEFSWNYEDLQVNRLFIVLAGVFGGIFFKLAIDRLEAQKRINAMEKEKTSAELNYLKAQINPHFLFNSLNSLYTQMELGSEDAKGTLISLADLLRYQLYECNVDFISVEKEMDYLKNYISLQGMRRDNCRIELRLDETQGNLFIAPLLLIHFVENAFKYLSDDEKKENMISVDISFKRKSLTFRCLNTVDTNRPHPTLSDVHKGIGLKNARKRLELIYKDKFHLETSAVNGLYQVFLTIDL